MICVGMLACVLSPLYSQQQTAAMPAAMPGAMPGFLSFRLENGLDVAIVTNPNHGSVRAELVFRGGSSAQTRDDAGIFSLISGFMRESRDGFGGSSPLVAWDASAAGSAQASFDGLRQRDAPIFAEPGIDRFVVGLDCSQERLESDLDTLRRISDPESIASLAQGPAMDAARNAALAATRSASLDPAALLEASVNRKLFGKYPWRRDIAGQEKILAGLSAEAVAAQARAWFVPNNALLVLAGNIDPERARIAAETAFGSWRRSADPRKQKTPAFPTPGVTRPTWLFRQDSAIPEGSARVDMRYRAPDPDSVPRAARAAALWAELAGNPAGRFAAALAKSAPGFMKSEGLGVRYVPETGSAWIGISATLKSENAASRSQQFKEVARNTEMYAMKTNASYFKPEEFEAARNHLLGKRTEAFESAAGAGRALADEWILWGLDLYATFPEALAKTGAKDIASLADIYFMKNLEVLSLGLNPADFAKQKKNLLANGFEEVSADKAFWWQK
jgi:zinc protease